jgi:hypothetical protein
MKKLSLSSIHRAPLVIWVGLAFIAAAGLVGTG